MEKFSSKFFIVSSLAAAVLLIGGVYVFAAYSIEKAKLLNYPIEELGGCRSFEECKVYCDKDENIPKCNRFSIENGLLTAEEVKDTELLISLMEESGLPGKCRGMIECFSYCESAAHIDECWDYTQRHNLNRGLDLETVRRLAALARAGERFPGGCTSASECETYCENTDHMEECLAFAEKAGLIPPEELEMARKVMPLMIRGETPGGCKSKEQCEAYCEDESNMEQCAQFALNMGMMTPEEYEMFKKTGGKGPGGCKGKEECESYCNDPAHQEDCFKFAEENGLIPPEELQHAREGMSRMKEGLQMAPPEVTDCLKAAVGTENFEKMQAGTLTPGPQIGEQVKTCFEQFMPQQGEMMGPPGGEFGPQGTPPGFEGGSPGGFSGPGGCKTQEECTAYCQQHPEECGQLGPSGAPSYPEGFQPPAGFQPPDGGQYPSPEEIKQQYEQQYQQQYQQQYPAPEQYQQQYPSPEQYQQQYPEYQPPQSTGPAGLAGNLLNFLANVLSAL